MVQWAYLISFSYSVRFHAIKPRVFLAYWIVYRQRRTFGFTLNLRVELRGERQDRGRLPSQRMNCASRRVVDVFSPFWFIIILFLRMGPQKGEIAQHSTVFSIFSQMDSWLSTLCYETLPHYWFAFTGTIKWLSVTIGIIQLVVSLPVTGIQVLITHSQQSINIYFKKNQKRCFIYLFTRDLGPYCYYFMRKKKG